MFYKKDLTNYRQAVEGVTYKTLTYGDKTSLGEFHLAKGYIIPNHSHPHEQTGSVVRRKGRFTIAGETTVVGPDDSWCIPGGVEHAVEELEDSEVIAVFSPLREAYLA